MSLFKKAQPSPNQPVTPPQAGTQPSNRVQLVSPQPTQQTPVAPASTNPMDDFFEKNPHLVPRNKQLTQKILQGEILFNNAQKILNDKRASSIISAIQVTDDPGYVIGGVNIDMVVSLEETQEAYKTWLKAKNDYLTTIRNITEEYRSYIPIIKQEKTEAEAKSGAQMAFIDKQIADYEAKFNEVQTTIEIEQRKNARFFALAPIQMEFLNVMSDLATLETEYKKTEAALGFGSKQQLIGIIQGYTNAAEIVMQFVSIAAKTNPQLAKQYLNISKRLQAKRQEYELKPFNRLFPGRTK